jgi:hypothetical protein
MANPLDDIAQALLVHATSLPGIVGGRTGEGGSISQTPFVEVGDGRGSITPLAAGGGGLDDIEPGFFVIYYERYNGANPEEQKRALRSYLWGLYTALKADETLGGLVEEARITEWDADLTTRNNTQYWFLALTISARWEAYG